MRKIILTLAAVSLMSACATDPYTGESKVSKTAWGTGIGAVARRRSVLWSAVKKAL